MLEPAPRTVHTVSELTEILRALIEDALPRVWVEGEVSNFSRPASGHWYFTLKDERAQLRCAMFRGQNLHVRPQPRDGDRVRARAAPGVYAARGDLQLICEWMEPSGEGELLRAFEALKRRLAAEGLFETALKRPLPPSVRRLGLITSATGAALQDVKAALARRFPLLPVALWPVPVQGAAAGPAIVIALRELPRRTPVDAILLVRGGGSLEDLWAFNEEAVARAIRACVVPVVTGIGHEIDTSIADFAADLRAPTPTAAAELVSPDRTVLLARLEQLQVQTARSLRRGLQLARERQRRGTERLAMLHPERALRLRAQRLDELEERLRGLATRAMLSFHARSRALAVRLHLCTPQTWLRAHDEQQRRLMQDLHLLQKQCLERLHARLARSNALLDSLKPQAVLDRGYAIARSADGQIIRDPAELAPQTSFSLTLARGTLEARRGP